MVCESQKSGKEEFVFTEYIRHILKVYDRIQEVDVEEEKYHCESKKKFFEFFISSLTTKEELY